MSFDSRSIRHKSCTLNYGMNFVEALLFHSQLRFDYPDFVFLVIDLCLFLTRDITLDFSKQFLHSFHHSLHLIVCSCTCSLLKLIRVVKWGFQLMFYIFA